MAKLVQVALESGTARRTCWVDQRKKLHLGSSVTLKNAEEPARWWTVCFISEPRDAAAIRSDWNAGGVSSHR